MAKVHAFLKNNYGKLLFGSGVAYFGQSYARRKVQLQRAPFTQQLLQARGACTCVPLAGPSGSTHATLHEPSSPARASVMDTDVLADIANLTWGTCSLMKAKRWTPCTVQLR